MLLVGRVSAGKGFGQHVLDKQEVSGSIPLCSGLAGGEAQVTPGAGARFPRDGRMCDRGMQRASGHALFRLE
jgi:hypothetical protein